MKISELIRELEKIKVVKGDLEVAKASANRVLCFYPENPRGGKNEI